MSSRSSFDMLDMLHTQSADTQPVALGGGWYGYTDRRNTAGWRSGRWLSSRLTIV